MSDEGIKIAHRFRELVWRWQKEIVVPGASKGGADSMARLPITKVTANGLAEWRAPKPSMMPPTMPTRECGTTTFPHHFPGRGAQPIPGFLEHGEVRYRRHPSWWPQ